MGTRTQRIAPVGAASPRAARSLLRNGRSHANPLLRTDQAGNPSRSAFSSASGRASASRRTSSHVAITPTLDRCAPPRLVRVTLLVPYHQDDYLPDLGAALPPGTLTTT